MQTACAGPGQRTADKGSPMAAFFFGADETLQESAPRPPEQQR
jgi:hypothetical protein